MVVEIEVDDSEREKGGRILVGVQIDGDGRELLRWAITNLAEEGDRLMAVNVLRSKGIQQNHSSVK